MKVRVLIAAALSLVLGSRLHAQAAYTASRVARFQGGVGGLFLDNDNTGRTAGGVTVYGDFDFSRYVGLEAEGHFGAIISPDDIGENTYFFGPRAYYKRHKLTVYFKIVFGQAAISNVSAHTSHNYNAYDFGGGVEYRIFAM